MRISLFFFLIKLKMLPPIKIPVQIYTHSLL
ncbi:RNA-metabolising metallo-beta-lactamase [Staphylococcus lugdunensis]|uniref:RNA-metabolising metallo-beta-lactamase n=1 Tax=Staphylococcus lugdunensis TaxID=28035 RepID=A0A4Q9WAJ5_STALU|nr:RNA-metabolising metallo-beta-lactamase [Staphylococcus lugdunensis]AVJ52710.1 RNA-metabolising metallo-beta-lactamase [Staphylococcus lugdunensis]MBM0804111.1 RNA-metabolising metallo-beta-lactamase [Staphylococcus lugdunensis]PNZ64739.1 RNA-metabolising metallo-beta-lactamase [Staphylococcus lugdunensis]QHP97403.1 RNA-metabolising metallo-beta-lactamase [Staphylococcus lugdunensis]